MKRQLIASILGLAAAVSAQGQGYITFQNYGSLSNVVVVSLPGTNSDAFTIYSGDLGGSPFVLPVFGGGSPGFPTNFIDPSQWLGQLLTNLPVFPGFDTNLFAFQVVTYTNSSFTVPSWPLWSGPTYPSVDWPAISGGFVYPIILNPPVPPNDNFSNAIVVSGTVISAVATNYAATAEPGEPEHLPGTPAAHSSWWRWVPEFSMRTTVTLNAYSGTLTVYEGDGLASLQRVATVSADGSTIVPPTGITVSGREMGSVAQVANAEVITQGPGVPSGPLLPTWPGTRTGAPTVTFRAQAGHTYYIATEGGAYISWKLEQQVLDFAGTMPSRGNVGLPMEFEAVSAESNSGPISVQFFVARPRRYVPPVVVPFTQVIELSYQLAPEANNLEIVDHSEVFQEPPYAVSWTPTNVGLYFVWACSTNSLGEVRETARQQVQVYAENDDLSRATILSPDLVSTNLRFCAYWATAESNEPPHKAGPLRFTRWWKWTPSSPARVRVKATRQDQGLSLEVFTGSAPNDLHLIANNSRTCSRPGFSGLIRLKVRAGQTYYFRSDEGRRTPAPPTNAWPYYFTGADSLLTVEPGNAPLPGELDPSQIVGSWRDEKGRVRMIALGRVYNEGWTPVVGWNYRAQLYTGSTSRRLTPAGPAWMFYPQPYPAIGPSFAGLYSSSPVILSNTLAGQRVFAQMRVWDSDAGETYETAAANGGAVGKSRLVRVVAGSEETGPTRLWGLGSIRLSEPRH